MALLLCASVEKGLRNAEATVTIEEMDGRNQFLPIDRGMLSKIDGKDYLTVSVIHVDEKNGACLVSLPVEADSGATRIWITCANLRNFKAVPA